MKQAQSIQRAKGLIMQFCNGHFPSNTKYCVLIVYLCHRSMVNSMKTSFAQQQSIFGTPSVNHMK